MGPLRDMIASGVRPAPAFASVGAMPIGKQGPAISRICQAYPDRVEVRGRDLADDLMGRLTFTDSFRVPAPIGFLPAGAAEAAVTSEA